jgi:UDP-glucose 4-epimerase
MRTVVVTGGSGFLGSLLVSRLAGQDLRVINIDLQPSPQTHPNLESYQADIRDGDAMARIFSSARIDTVFHCAAMLAHGSVDSRTLWTSNVDGTRQVAETARRTGVERLIYTSSNCLWGESFGRPVREDDAPHPVEAYGLSKWEGEKALKEFEGDLQIVTLRCPTIIDEGRLGLLTILFDFIAENRKVWVVGSGANRYQFIYAQDLIGAMLRVWDYRRSGTFGIGSDDVRPMRDIYQYVIEKAGSGSRVMSLPKAPTLLAMRLAHLARISPLGPYHYKMIAEDFSFDTSAIKRELVWAPTVANHEMLYRAYRYYFQHRAEIQARKNVSAHRSASQLGVINVLKWLS